MILGRTFSSCRSLMRRRKRQSNNNTTTPTRAGKTENLYGIHAVASALEWKKRRGFQRLYTVPKNERNASVERVVKMAAKARIPVSEMGRKGLAGMAPHPQGVVLECDRYPTATADRHELASLLEEQPGRVAAVALDGVTDPVNVGSVIRSAAFYGVSLVLVPPRKSAPMSPVVAHVAAGGLDAVRVIVLDSFASSLKSVASRDNISIVASALHPSSVPLTSLPPFPSQSSKCVLVLGSEDKGVRTPIVESADLCVAITPSPSSRSLVQSLNVNTAAATLLHTLSHL